MTARLRVVLDTNVLVSRLLLPRSVPARAVRHTMAEHIVLASDATMMELAEVLSRRKFDPYITIEDRKTFLRLFGCVAEPVSVLHALRVCRDPKDDRFLERAVSGQADVVVTGNADLLALNPFREIGIMDPAAFLSFDRDSWCPIPK